MLLKGLQAKKRAVVFHSVIKFTYICLAAKTLSIGCQYTGTSQKVMVNFLWYNYWSTICLSNDIKEMKVVSRLKKIKPISLHFDFFRNRIDICRYMYCNPRKALTLRTDFTYWH